MLRIIEAKLIVKIAKSKFAPKGVKYLDHLVGKGQRKPAEAKIKAITELQPPKAKTEIRRYLGMAGILLALHKELCLDSRTAHESAKREK